MALNTFFAVNALYEGGVYRKSIARKLAIDPERRRSGHAPSGLARSNHTGPRHPGCSILNISTLQARVHGGLSALQLSRDIYESQLTTIIVNCI